MRQTVLFSASFSSIYCDVRFFFPLALCLAENKINRNHINNANIFFHVTGNVSNSNHKYKYRQQRKAWAVLKEIPIMCERHRENVYEKRGKIWHTSKLYTATQMSENDLNENKGEYLKKSRIFEKKSHLSLLNVSKIKLNFILQR